MKSSQPSHPFNQPAPLPLDPALAGRYPTNLIGHGQHGEDYRLEEIFAQVSQGVCIEVGAFDGVVGSATYAFELLGWTTILVEPQPDLAAAIARSRRGRLFAVAAGDHPGEVWIAPHPTDPAQTGVSARPPETDGGEDAAPVAVPMRTLDSILAECGVDRVDFATIDVEGFELAVLKGWDLDRWRPRVVILEDNTRGLDTTIPHYLRERGYVCFAHTGVNDWYAHSSDRALATTVACLRQRLRKALHPLLFKSARLLLPGGIKILIRRVASAR